MAYIPSNPTNLNRGSQQVNVHPKQEITSFNANKLFQGLFLPGVYNAEVLQPTFSSPNFTFTVKKGTTLLFEKEHDFDSVIGKIVLQDDAELDVDSSVITGFSSNSISIVASWNYVLSDPTNIYCRFLVIDEADLPTVISGNDLVVATFLNHTNGKGNPSLYKIAYQNDTNRNFLTNLYEINKNFPVTFNGTGTSIVVGSGNCVLGDTYIRNSSTLTAATGGVWPTPLPDPGGTYKQIDVLRIKNQDALTENQVVHLEWESFLKLSAGFTTIKAFIDGYDFVFEDIGYNVLYCVRDWTGLLSTSPIWPQDCFIVNPLMPQVGVPETVSRFKLPIY